MKSKATFWDTSAIVPLCAQQPASIAVRRLARTSQPLVVWWGTRIESFSALARLLRDGVFTQRQFLQTCRKLEVLQKSWVEMEPTEQIRTLTKQVLLNHALSTADGLQLAAALVWCDERPRDRIFVCCDRRLSEAAEKVGFDVRSW
jgi:predicted nucleic acid-binding protein